MADRELILTRHRKILCQQLKGVKIVANIIGTPNNDNLVGTIFNDYLDAGLGNDTLDGWLGADTMRGGDGNDTYFVNSFSDVVKEDFDDAKAGVDTVNSSV
ncbi:calcium-binding protein, partial [Richelia sinica FACHB-800]|nr:calcium-binding protein [Richelia sinica FACHB-800]